MRARASVHIEREPEAVFARIADFATHAQWRPEVASSQVLGEVGRGARVIQHVSAAGHGATVEVEITEFEPPERLSFRYRGTPRARGGFRLEREGGGTRVHMSATVELDGAASLVEGRIRAVAEEYAQRGLTRLKELLESGG